MEINLTSNKDHVYKTVNRAPIYEFDETRVALWHLPTNNRYLEFDEDENKWFDSSNKNNNNEIEIAQKALKIDFSKYEVHTNTKFYNDLTYEIESIYQNGNRVREIQGSNHLFFTIKNRLGQLVAEKVFGTGANDGKKYIYSYAKKGNNVFKITKVYSYDTSKNRQTDVVNYGYTSDPITLSKGCKFEKEFYTLNNKEVEAIKINEKTYMVTDESGQTITFKVE